MCIAFTVHASGSISIAQVSGKDLDAKGSKINITNKKASFSSQNSGSITFDAYIMRSRFLIPDAKDFTVTMTGGQEFSNNSISLDHTGDFYARAKWAGTPPAAEVIGNARLSKK